MRLRRCSRIRSAPAVIRTASTRTSGTTSVREFLAAPSSAAARTRRKRILLLVRASHSSSRLDSLNARSAANEGGFAKLKAADDARVVNHLRLRFRRRALHRIRTTCRPRCDCSRWTGNEPRRARTIRRPAKLRQSVAPIPIPPEVGSSIRRSCSLPAPDHSDWTFLTLLPSGAL